MVAKIQKTELRFGSKKQKNALKRIAVKNKHSMNAEINRAIDFYIEHHADGIEGFTKADHEALKEKMRPIEII